MQQEILAFVMKMIYGPLIFIIMARMIFFFISQLDLASSKIGQINNTFSNKLLLVVLLPISIEIDNNIIAT